jgi:hypothetical protein
VSRHKRPHLNHIVLLPRLFTSEWRRTLYKLADAVIELPAGSRPFWSSAMHEPLLMGLILRFSLQPPWQSRNHPGILELVRSVQRVWPQLQADEQPLLRQLCLFPGTMDSLS